MILYMRFGGKELVTVNVGTEVSHGRRGVSWNSDKRASVSGSRGRVETGLLFEKNG
jgi:hypothetical protein